MEGITWKDRVTNEDVLRQVGESRKLLDTIRRRKNRWIGHILRHPGLFRDVMEGRMEGKRGRGRKRIMLLDDIKNGRGFGEMKRDVEDRDKWRSGAT